MWFTFRLNSQIIDGTIEMRADAELWNVAIVPSSFVKGFPL